jgi:hypothetical protein
MSLDEALEWIAQVDGRLYQNPRKRGEPDAWVAVVRTPGANPVGRGRVIVASGSTLQQATHAAEAQWNRVWEALGEPH